MEINKYLKSIDISDLTEEQLKSFLAQKEEEIQCFIMKAWNDYRIGQANEVNEVPINGTGEKSENKAEDHIKDIVSDLPESEKVNESLIEKSLIEIYETDAKVELQNPAESLPEHIQGLEIPTTNTKENVLNQDAEKKEIEQKLLKEKEKEKKAAEAFELQIKNKTITIPNGKVNQPYRFVFNIDEIGLSDIGYYWFDGINTTGGLNYDSVTHEITGVPTVAGEHRIKLKIKRKDWIEGKPIFEREVTMIINPDPKSLWKNIPTPKNIEYYKPDSDKRFIDVGKISKVLGITMQVKKNMVAASQRGRSHAHEGKARDDDFGMYYCKKNEWYIMTVADGAGSANSSRKGSEIACKTVIEECQIQLESHHKEFEHQIIEFNYKSGDENRKKVGDNIYSIIGSAVFRALKNINEEAKASAKPIKDFSTTLIISICKKFKFGWFVGAFWVGDGGIAIFHKDKQFLKILGESDGGEFAGQTRFLTMPEISQSSELYRRLRFEIVEDFTALILMTDGVSDPKFETDKNLGNFERWNDLWNDLSENVNFKPGINTTADQLLSWLDFWSPGNHDDRTIAILY